jgi:hypothetical protein
MKKAGSKAGFFYFARNYFFVASGLPSLTEDGTEGVDEAPAAPGVAPGVALELEAPPPIAELDDAPVPPGVAVESAPAAGEGVGVGAATGALGAGGGVVTVFSSFLQAVRPTANRAAMRMERVICISL